MTSNSLSAVEKKEIEEVNIKFLVEEMQKDAEEYGQLHDKDCPFMRENGADFGDVCECETIRTLKTFAREWMVKVNQKWIHMTREHLPYCRPEGRKRLIEGYGGRPHSEEHKKKISDSVRKAKKSPRLPTGKVIK